MKIVIEDVTINSFDDGGWLAGGGAFLVFGDTPMMAYMNRLETMKLAEYNKLIDCNYSLKSQKECMDVYRDDIQEVSQ